MLQQVTLSSATCTVDDWVEAVRLHSLSMTWPGISVDQRMSFRGDALELLTEFLVKSGQLNTKTGLQDYRVVGLKDDYGVDATGVNVNGDFTVVQCKYRRIPTNLVHYADLARTFTQGALGFSLRGKLDLSKQKNVWLVTTANDANIQSKTVLGKHLHVIGRGHLAKVLDGNTAFWQSFLASV